MVGIIFFLFNMGSLIESPSTYVPPRGSYDLEFRFGVSGSMIGKVGISPFDGFVFGISYGGKRVLGAGEPNWHGGPGVQARFGISGPDMSFAVGLDSEQYEDSAIGIYGVGGGSLGNKIIPYLGVNYYKKPGLFCGIEAGMSEEGSFLAEGLYEDKEFILSAGFRWLFEQRIMIEFDFKDLLGGKPIRILKFSYTDYI